MSIPAAALFALACLSGRRAEAASRSQTPENPKPFALVQAIPLENVRGRIDRLAIDPAGRRLFISAADEDEIEVVDLRGGRLASRIGGFSQPRGLAWIAPLQQLVAADGGEGRVTWLRGETFEPVYQTQLDNPDGVRYDPDSKLVYVTYGHGGLAAFEAATSKPAGRLELKGHPAGFDFDPEGPRIFVNLPAARQIAVVDRSEWSLTSVWDLSAARNFPMSVDKASGRVLVAMRRPPRLLVLDAKTGRELSSTAACADADDLWFDPSRGRAYLSCGEGYTEVFKTPDGDRYERVLQIPTARSARTSLFDPDEKRLYVAVPARIGRSAQILVFRTD